MAANLVGRSGCVQILGAESGPKKRPAPDALLRLVLHLPWSIVICAKAIQAFIKAIEDFVKVIETFAKTRETVAKAIEDFAMTFVAMVVAFQAFDCTCVADQEPRA
jgi:hypothetical protein